MPSRSVPRVFVVDDENVIASSLTAIMKFHGYLATFFTSPLEALDAARVKAPDLLISDVEMPGLSGLDLAIQMKVQHPTCKILLFSGRVATLALLEEARAQGHDFGFVLKPLPATQPLLEVGPTVNGATRAV